MSQLRPSAVLWLEVSVSLFIIIVFLWNFFAPNSKKKNSLGFRYQTPTGRRSRRPDVPRRSHKSRDTTTTGFVVAARGARRHFSRFFVVVVVVAVVVVQLSATMPPIPTPSISSLPFFSTFFFQTQSRHRVSFHRRRRQGRTRKKTKIKRRGKRSLRIHHPATEKKTTTSRRSVYRESFFFCLSGRRRSMIEA